MTAVDASAADHLGGVLPGWLDELAAAGGAAAPRPGAPVPRAGADDERAQEVRAAPTDGP